VAVDEAYIVILGTRGQKRYAERRPLCVPVALATGDLERLSNRALNDAIQDLTAEQLRRFAS